MESMFAVFLKASLIVASELIYIWCGSINNTDARSSQVKFITKSNKFQYPTQPPLNITEVKGNVNLI